MTKNKEGASSSNCYGKGRNKGGHKWGWAQTGFGTVSDHQYWGMF